MTAVLSCTKRSLDVFYRIATTSIVIVLASACTPATDPGGTTTTTSTVVTSPARVVGYLTEWGIYARDYQPKNLVTSGSASKLTHVNVAFGNVTNGQCTPGDAYAETGKVYTAANSVDGVADATGPDVLHGVFGQLRKLKAMYPGLKVLWSFGGATWSAGFAQAAQNPTAFAESCHSLLHDARWDGLFDGIDIDWEYPTDSTSYPALMTALRSRFGSELVTSAVPAGSSKIATGGYGAAASAVDWFNVMTYDYFGAWSANGPTAAHSPLTDYPGIPAGGLNTQATLTAYRNLGIPAAKLLMGVGSYGRGWSGVSQSAPGGTATGPAAGTYAAGVEDYKVLSVTCPPTGVIGGTAYASCGTNWWSYDTPSTLASKMIWARGQGLGGAFIWDLSGDTPTGALLDALHTSATN